MDDSRLSRDINGHLGYLVDCVECAGTGVATIYDADGIHEDQCPDCGGAGEVWVAIEEFDTY